MARMPKSRLTTPDPDGPHGQMPRGKAKSAPKGAKLSSGPGSRFGAGKGMGGRKGC